VKSLSPIASGDYSASRLAASEDFAFMLQQKPGCYIWIGNGASENSCLLHNPRYDFNNDILAIGVAYWVKLVETILS
jgi:hippurate hydrolase